MSWHRFHPSLSSKITWGLILFVAIGVGMTIAGPPSANAEPQSPGQVQMPASEIEIVSFHQPVDPTRVTATTGRSTSDMPTITVAEGEGVVLRWVVRVRRASRTTATLNYPGHTIDLMLGTPRDEADGWKRYENQRAVTVTEAGVYTMRVVGFPGGGSKSTAEKSIRINVREAGIQVRQPRVDAATRRVTFVVHNTGDIPAEGRFTVRYQIQGRNPMRPLLESSMTTEPMTIQLGHDADLGHVDLPAEAQQSAQLWMRVGVSLMGRASVPESSRDFTYDWPTHNLRITSGQLRALGELLGGDILIHNYNDPHAETTEHIPLLNGGSHLTLLGRTFPFDFQRFIYESAKIEHYFFVNNFGARLGGPEFLNIENGKIVMRANFDCGASEREVKGWTRDYIGKRYVDNTTPDVDIQRFNLTVELNPILAAGKLSYNNVTLSIDSAMRFPGGWAWLNGFKDWMNREVQRSVRGNFVSTLNDPSIKNTIETELANVLNLAAIPNTIHQIISVRGSGTEVIVSYR